MIRTGRPKSDNPKNIGLRIRFDEETDRNLRAYAKKYNMSRANVLRQGLKMILDSDKNK